ncbi:MAG: hypothetical protein ACM31C_14535, partial [Acidobacteriota bacterium]
DAGELPAIVDFVMKGGLEQAARRDLERERAALEREKAQLGGSGSIQRQILTLHVDQDRGRAVVDLLFSLFS